MVGKSVMLWGVSGGLRERLGEGGTGGEEKKPVEGSGAVEEFEVEGGGGLAVDFAAGAGLHGHCWMGVKGVMLYRVMLTVLV